MLIVGPTSRLVPRSTPVRPERSAAPAARQEPSGSNPDAAIAAAEATGGAADPAACASALDRDAGALPHLAQAGVALSGGCR